MNIRKTIDKHMKLRPKTDHDTIDKNHTYLDKVIALINYTVIIAQDSRTIIVTQEQDKQNKSRHIRTMSMHTSHHDLR